MCDFVHVLLIDRLERQVLADRQVAFAAGMDLPIVSVEIDRFEEALNADAAPQSIADVDLYELNRALGVA